MSRPSVLMVGTGEYTTGYVHNGASGSDKSAGVVALSLFDMRRRGKVGRLMMAGTNGNKFPGIRRHLHNVIGRVYKDLDVSFQSFPDDDIARRSARPIWPRWTSWSRATSSRCSRPTTRISASRWKPSSAGCTC